jgi:hypothetical protein
MIDEPAIEAWGTELATVTSDVRDRCFRAALAAWEQALADSGVTHLDFPARMALLQEAIDALCDRLTRPN